MLPDTVQPDTAHLPDWAGFFIRTTIYHHIPPAALILLRQRLPPFKITAISGHIILNICSENSFSPVREITHPIFTAADTLHTNHTVVMLPRPKCQQQQEKSTEAENPAGLQQNIETFLRNMKIEQDLPAAHLPYRRREQF
ncbi:hypothetical protein [Neisseria leonii]|uniref:hypothetical protein n=1 Tax=Neisseria leonii TaxID=2995413 RepID=UPI00237BBE18|nr:hypothetical protein [Neisseria sp. 3986]MDD9325112.1 hypothetical protein [Neisseria sp. 3986]